MSKPAFDTVGNIFLLYNISMFSDPLKNLKTLELRENSIVADLGAGTGFYTIPAGVIAHKGKVYAVDIARDFLETIKNKVEEYNLHHVQIICGNVAMPDGTQIGDSIVDAVIVANVLFQVEDKHQLIDEVKRILKSKGRVLFTDWYPDSFVISSRMAIPKEKARALFEQKGFIVDREINTGDHHYGMILIKQ